MPKSFPTYRFNWLDPAKSKLDKHDDDSSGCILAVDLEYPEELHKVLNDYPLAPGKLKIKNNCCLTIN